MGQGVPTHTSKGTLTLHLYTLGPPGQDGNEIERDERRGSGKRAQP